MADEFLQALKAIWTSNPVEFHGKFYQIPESYVNRKPVQKPHPPIYLAAFAPAAMKRLATVADGWTPVAIPVDGMAQMFSAVKQMAKEAGRDLRSATELIGSGRAIQRARQSTKRDVSCGLSSGALLGLGGTLCSRGVSSETIPVRSLRTGCANHLQREHTKIGGFAFAGFVLFLRFCAGLFLTLWQAVARHNNFVAKVRVQIDFRALQPINSPVLLREPDFLGLITLNQAPRY
jgi:hypothetical protein